MRATAETFKNIREVVAFINERNIQKEDILDIVDKGEQLFLIYYLS